MKLAELKINQDNPRYISDSNLTKLKASIREFERMLEIRPIVVDDDNVVLGGNMRVRALDQLGYIDVPDVWVKKVSGLTQEEKKQFIIKDNIGFGDWDWEKLANEWDIDELDEWGLDVPDVWADSDIEIEDDDYEIDNDVETNIKIGDLIEIGSHRLLCGDSTKVESYEVLFDGEKSDLNVTDPPYNLNYTGKTKDKLKIKNDNKSDEDFYSFLFDFYSSLESFTNDGVAWYIWHADSEGHNFRSAMKNSGIEVKQCLIWVKNSMVFGRQDYHWQHESCLYGWKKGTTHSWYSDRKQTTLLNFDRPTMNQEHPTMKPVPLIAYQIKNSSKKGDIVCDSFCGSGTTMVACEQLSRICYGIEYDPRFCQVIINRMIDYVPGIEVKVNGVQYEPIN